MDEYSETFIDGMISFEQNIQMKQMEGSLGIQVSLDGRVWVCIDGRSIIRFKPKPKLKELINLLPCPFCGKKPNEPVLYDEVNEWAIECLNCDYEVADVSKIELIKKWNTRNG